MSHCWQITSGNSAVAAHGRLWGLTPLRPRRAQNAPAVLVMRASAIITDAATESEPNGIPSRLRAFLLARKDDSAANNCALAGDEPLQL